MTAWKKIWRWYNTSRSSGGMSVVPPPIESIYYILLFKARKNEVLVTFCFIAITSCCSSIKQRSTMGLTRRTHFLFVSYQERMLLHRLLQMLWYQEATPKNQSAPRSPFHRRSPFFLPHSNRCKTKSWPREPFRLAPPKGNTSRNAHCLKTKARSKQWL